MTCASEVFTVGLGVVYRKEAYDMCFRVSYSSNGAPPMSGAARGSVAFACREEIGYQV